MDFIQIGFVVVDWVHLAKDTEQWRTDLNNVMNLRDLQMRGIP
jgi:hypothetical protein